MAQTVLGTPVNFGFPGGVSATEFTGKILLQNVDYEETSDEEQVKDGEGVLVSRSFYNPGFKATLEYIPKGSNIAGAKTNTDLPAIGTVINITAAAEMPDLVKSNWIVVPGGKITGSNTGAKRITLPIESFASVTTAAS